MPTEYTREESTYIIDPESGAETARLLYQDNLLTQSLGGLFPVEIDKESEMRVLDLACGPGGWALNVAYECPKAEVYGIDISQLFVRYAKAQAWSRRLDNVFFEVMDVLKPLEFDDAAFDMVNARLLASFTPTKAWPEVLKECMRVLRPGGLLCLAECEMGISNSAGSEELTHTFLLALQKAGMIFSPDARHVGITSVLSGLVRDAGFADVQQMARAIDYSFGAPMHNAFSENIIVGSKLAQPFMVKMGVATQEEIDPLYERMVSEVRDEQFRAIWYYLRVWGRKQ